MRTQLYRAWAFLRIGLLVRNSLGKCRHLCVTASKGGVLTNCQPPVHSAPHPPPHPPIRSPVGPVGTPACQSGRPLAISPAARQSPSPAACLLAGPSVQPFASPAARQPASPPARPARVLASLAVLRSDHPPTCPTRRPSVGPAVRRSSHPIARQPGISPTWPPTCPPIRSSKRVRNFDRWAIGDGRRASPFASLRPSGRRRAPAAMGAGLHRAHVPLSSAPHANPGRWRA